MPILRLSIRYLAFSTGHSVILGISSSPILNAASGIGASLTLVAVPMASMISTDLRSTSATDKLVTGNFTVSPGTWSVTKTGLI